MNNSSNFDERLVNLNDTLPILEKAGFEMSVDKCQFAVDKIKLLRFVVTGDSVLPDPNL